MQTMSDKEFDELFREKFDSYRPEPSPRVWEGISAQLQQKNKATFPIYRLVAACFLMALGTSLFLLNDKEPVKLYGNVKAVEVVSDSVTENVDGPIKTVDKSAERIPSYKRKEAFATNSLKTISANSTDDTDTETAPLEKEQKISPSKPFYNLEKAKSIDTVKSLTETQETSFLAINTPPEEPSLSLEDNVPPRQKIKTMADIVNFVVAKVDKRENKIIEFSKEDDGDIVSGLNLGLVQFRTKNK